MNNQDIKNTEAVEISRQYAADTVFTDNSPLIEGNIIKQLKQDAEDNAQPTEKSFYSIIADF